MPAEPTRAASHAAHRTAPTGYARPLAASRTCTRTSARPPELLKALGNEQRLLILCNLLEGPLTVGALNARVDLSQSALSQHLALLREAGLVETRREAQSIYYSLPPGPVTRVMAVLQDIYCGGRPARAAPLPAEPAATLRVMQDAAGSCSAR